MKLTYDHAQCLVLVLAALKFLVPLPETGRKLKYVFIVLLFLNFGNDRTERIHVSIKGLHPAC